MKAVVRFLQIALFCACWTLTGFAQNSQRSLVKRMSQHENNILYMYLEYQKLYYEDKSREHELRAFEDLLTVYIDQVTEIYETLTLSERKTELPREIASRTLVFKALMYLEKAPLNYEYYERACYEYYKSLNLYDGTDEAPVIFKDLPQQIQAGDKTYYRLKDLLDDKGKGLRDFGKVKLSFRNFMVTANFDPEMLELITVESGVSSAAAPHVSNKEYTFNLAETIIKYAFAEVFQSRREVETYVALPAGTYVLRLHGGRKSGFTALTRFYVQANQEQHYVMEPLADWIILYENPTSRRPDYYHYRRNKNLLASDGLGGSFGLQTNGDVEEKVSGSADGESATTANHETLVAEIVADMLPNYEIRMMFELNDPEIKDNAIQIIARSIVHYVESQAFYNKWNLWSASWEISTEVRDVISPGSLVPIELLELVYNVIKEM
ncbi:MAG: hypothetical protein ACE5IY_03590 [bacterium]